MGATLYPPARYRAVRNTSGAMAKETRGFLPHVQQGDGSLFGWFDNPASQVSAHLWFAKDGRVEQYVPFDRRAWAQAAGNSAWISAECEGWTYQDYTTAQIRNLAMFFAWGVREFGWHAQLTDSPSGYGVGTHRMGGAAWGGHSCPGDLRAGRRTDILRAALTLLSPKPTPPPELVMTPEQDARITAALNKLPRAVADILTEQMRQAVTGDPDREGAQVRMADVRLGSLGEALGLLVLRSSFEMSRGEQIRGEVSRIGDHLGADGPLNAWAQHIATELTWIRAQLEARAGDGTDLSPVLRRLDNLRFVVQPAQL